MPRKNHRSGEHGGNHRPRDERTDPGRRAANDQSRADGPVDRRPNPNRVRPRLADLQAPAGRHALTIGSSESEPRARRAPSQPYNVILSAHAERQLDVLGSPAEHALKYLRQAGRDELQWSAQPMPSQRGRDVWLLGAGTVRVLLDVEGDDLTIQGFGLQPGRRSMYW
jgi:hypothetical protein